MIPALPPVSPFVVGCANGEERKLTSMFPKKFKVLETQFCYLIPTDTVKDQFEDFIEENYEFVKDMNESQFMEYIINIKSGAYDDFVR